MPFSAAPLAPRLSRPIGPAVFVALGLGLCLPPAALAAEPPTPPGEAAKRDPAEAKARAQKHFERGIAAYKESRFKDAIDAFLDAHREYPSPTLSFNTARAYEKMGDATGALRFYREYLRQAPNASDKATVEARTTELEAKLQERGIQQVTILSNVEGATVLVDGRPVGITPWTGEILPGRHTLGLKRDGYVDGSTEFELSAHRAADVVLDLEVAPKAPPVKERAPESGGPMLPKDQPEGIERVGIPTWVAFGLGAAALGGAAVFEGLRANSEDSVKNEPAQVDRHEAYDRMQDQQTVARILAGVGAAGVVVGGVLLYFDLSSGSERAPSTAMGFGCSQAGCGAAVRGRF